MAEFTLRPRSGFAGLAIPGGYGASGAGDVAVVIAEHTDLTLTQLAAFHGKTEEIAAVLKNVTGLDLPNRPKRVEARGIAVIGIAPTQWLLVAEGEAGKSTRSALEGSLAGLASIVDQSDSKAILRVSGARARETLAKGCALDLHPRAFGPGDAGATQVALIPCLISQIDETPTFQLAVPLSYARSFWSWLTASAAGYGYEVSSAPKPS